MSKTGAPESARNGIHRIWKCDQIELGYSRMPVGESTHFTSPYRDDDFIRLHAGLRGNYSFTHHQLNSTFDLIGGHINLMYSRGFSMDVTLHSDTLETFGIKFPRELFVSIAGTREGTLGEFSRQVKAGENCILNETWGAITPELGQVIQEIMGHTYSGELQRIFLLGKSLETLVATVAACERPGSGFIRRRSDRARLNEVRDLINNNLQAPPRLADIARQVGLNEYKLKKGFKELFHTTVFGYLAEQRLQKARIILRQTEKTVAEISDELGYSSPQHFHTAFRNRFNMTPNSIRKAPQDEMRPR